MSIYDVLLFHHLSISTQQHLKCKTLYGILKQPESIIISRLPIGGFFLLLLLLTFALKPQALIASNYL